MQEIRGDLRTLTLESRENGCWEGAMAAVEAWAKGTDPKPVWPGALMQGLSSTVWEVAKSGALAHMDLDERLGIAGFYDGIQNQLGLVLQQRAHAAAMQGYLNRDALDPEEAHALLRLMGEMRTNLRAETRNIPTMLTRTHQRGIEPGPPNADYESRVDALCAAFPQPAAVGAY